MKAMPKKFGGLLRSLSSDAMVSESAVAPIRLKYLGTQSVPLDGNDDWDATVDKGEAYELVPAANARGKAAIVLRIERKREAFYIENRENLLRILAGTKFPKKMDLDNLLYATGKGVTKGQGLVEVGTVSEDINDMATHKWYLAAGVKMYMDSAKRHYLSFDLKNPLESILPKTKIARLKASFKAAPVKSEVKEIREKAAVALSVPVTNPSVGARNAVIPPKVLAETSYGFLAVTPHAQHAKDSWVVYAPTRAALTRQLDVLYVAAGEPMAKAGKVELYKIVRQSPLVQQLGKRAVAMSTAEIKSKATFMRMVSFAAPIADGHEPQERPWTDIDPQDLNVSWSDFDPAETRLALTKLFNEGYFSAKLRPRPTTKGLVFDIPNDSRSGRDEIHGAARRVYQWLHNIGIPHVKVVAKWAPTKALLDFQFPALSVDAKESIRLLREKPPVIGAPIYTLDTQQHRTFQIYAVDLNSGNVFMYPVRNAQPLTNEPLTVLYAKVQRLVK